MAVSIISLPSQLCVRHYTILYSQQIYARQEGVTRCFYCCSIDRTMELMLVTDHRTEHNRTKRVGQDMEIQIVQQTDRRQKRGQSTNRRQNANRSILTHSSACTHRPSAVHPSPSLLHASTYMLYLHPSPSPSPSTPDINLTSHPSHLTPHPFHPPHPIPSHHSQPLPPPTSPSRRRSFVSFNTVDACHVF